MTRILLLSFAFLVACASPVTNHGQCADREVQQRRSHELQMIRDADQADRRWQARAGKQPSQSELEQMVKNDRARLNRVAEISNEGCLKSAADLEAAFLIYQHGNTSEHFFQAYLWAKEAIKLGAVHLKSGMAMAVDRYLVSTGNKQLFGTQASQAKTGGCWCIQPIEENFPTELRAEYRGGVNAAYTGLDYLKVLNQGLSCPASFCPTQLRPTPKGSVPGFW